MSDIIIMVDMNDKKLINKIKNINGNIIESKDNNFDGDSSLITFLITTITPIVVTQLVEIIKIIIQNPSRGRIKIKGVEIEGFTFEETKELLDKISK